MIKVEVLFFAGCPNHEPAVQLARDVIASLGIAAELREIAVEEQEDAETLRFLGSPSVRVNGRDIEPGAEDRTGFALSCRVYGAGGRPQREWLVAALKGT
ncbi:MAG: DUF2703 domain-containing protein [Deltaproteobacteria bacterium]|nr:DUF2703 domain-containing protein [Deltaproteobacteria bacterium]